MSCRVVGAVTLRRFTTEDLDEAFPDDAACLEFLRLMRWPDGIRCRRCERFTKH